MPLRVFGLCSAEPIGGLPDQARGAIEKKKPQSTAAWSVAWLRCFWSSLTVAMSSVGDGMVFAHALASGGGGGGAGVRSASLSEAARGRRRAGGGTLLECLSCLTFVRALALSALSRLQRPVVPAHSREWLVLPIIFAHVLIEQTRSLRPQRAGGHQHGARNSREAPPKLVREAEGFREGRKASIPRSLQFP